MKRTISVMMGKGSLTHNNRDFIAENVDAEHTKNNITYCNENIKTVYHELFDDALEKYNAKQTRKDRVIDDYYEKIRTGKQEKLFHEIILQIGDKDNMGVETEHGELAKKILDKYMQGFQESNPNLRVFSAHLHMDEATPHLHIDFVPFTTGSKRGLETRVSLKKALEAQGFVGKGRSDTEWNRWVESEKEKLADIMLEHSVEWDKKGTHEKHKSVSEFKRDKLTEEVEALEDRKQECIDDISKYKKAEDFALATAKKLENEALKLQEPTPLMSAKTYKTKYAEPFIKKLIKTIKDLARRCFRAEKAEKQSVSKIARLADENKKLKSRIWDLNIENTRLKVQIRDFDRLKEHLGIDKVKEILKTVGKSRQKKKADILR